MKGEREEAIQEYREAIRLDPKNAKAHYNLGFALAVKGEREEAIQEYREAIRSDPKDAKAHYNLGVALQAKGQLNEAIKEYRAAIDLDPEDAYARSELPKAEQMAKVEPKLTAILESKEEPADAAERLALANLCQQPFNKLYAASVRFYEGAFAADANLADDMQQHHRYNAACAAALAGCGQGKDADKLDEKAPAGLRQRAVEWLRADLALWTKQADSADPEGREAVQQKMKHWQTDADLAGVRDKDALAKLPAEEQEAWRKLWDDVSMLLKRASEPR
jgi:tetratricopeptide (TPR) repeat protein